MAKALMTWVPVGVGVAVAMLVAGLGWPVAVGAGIAIGAGLTVANLPRRPRRPRIDPFTIGEPWRQHVQAAQRSAAQLHRTVREMRDGPLRERMTSIANRLDDGLDETWRIARRGNELDAAVKRMDPTALSLRLNTLEQRSQTEPSADVASALASVESQIEATERLKVRAGRTEDRLRLTQTRYDELVVRATEVTLGADTDDYAHAVDDLVVELEGMRLALDEVTEADS
ncbi:MAG: hypothetical protein HRT86_01965 [Ilumatobacteraceae bacterium]|nr:hypothetical protein [Ilumatobacteraceae bacterium]